MHAPRRLARMLRLAKQYIGGMVPVRGSLWGWVREPYAGAWQKGVTLDPIGSLTAYSAVYACINRRATDIAKMSIALKQRQADGIEVLASPLSPFWIPIRRPNGYQNLIQFITLWMVFKLLYGNTYALKARDERGMVRALYLLDPRRVTPQVTPDGGVYYSVGADSLSRVPTGVVIPASEIIHDRCIPLWHPLVGVSPIYACAASATQGTRIQGNSAIFFENMSRPSGMLTAPGTIDEVTAKRLKEEWEKNYSGMNIGRLAVLGDGLKYEPMTIPAEQAQLIQQLDWTVADVARAFGMPLYKIGVGPMPTNNNVEALDQQYLGDCLQADIEAIETCLTVGCDLPSDLFYEFETENLLRMDTASRVKMLGDSVQQGLRAPNEARRELNLPPLKGGDTIYLQQQMFSLEALARRDALDDPFGLVKPSPAPAAPAPPPVAAEGAEKALLAAFGMLEGRLDSALAQIGKRIDELPPMPTAELAALAQRVETVSRGIDDMRDAARSVGDAIEQVKAIAPPSDAADDAARLTAMLLDRLNAAEPACAA